jgi:DNA-directed RNA polymerase subunit RPC12/RpoP
VTEKQTVWCDGCGRQLDESPSTRDEERIACPDCGSQARKVDIGVASGVEVTDVAKAKARSGEAGKPGGGGGWSCLRARVGVRSTRSDAAA